MSDGFDVDSLKPVDATLKEGVCLSSNGDLNILGYNFPVGPEIAPLLRPAVDQTLNWLSLRGAAVAEQYGARAAEVVLPKHHAAKVGGLAYYGWMFGPSVANFGLEIKTTVHDGFKEIYALRDEAQPLLDANKDASIGSALTSNFSAFAHKRAQVYHDFKREVAGTIASGVRLVPNILLGYYQSRLDRIKDPDKVFEAKTWEGMPQQQRNLAEAERKRLQSLQANDDELAEAVPRRAAEGNIVTDTLHAFSGPKRNVRPHSELDYADRLEKGKWFPALGGVAGEIINNRIVNKNKETPELAWDKIIALQVYMHHAHPHQDSVAERVKGIFAQHAKDLKRNYRIDGYEFDTVADLIAGAIVHDHLHPQALAEILDNKKIVTFGPKDVDFGDAGEVKEQLNKLVAKYNGKLGEKEVYKNAPFTKETLPATYEKIPPEEKPFFTMLFPQGVLERAGVPAQEVAKNREAASAHFTDELVDRIRLVVDAGREELRKDGVKPRYIDEIDALKPGFTTADGDGEAKEFVEGNKNAVDALRKIEASAKDPAGMWTALAARGETHEAIRPRTLLEHAEREPGDVQPMR